MTSISTGENNNNNKNNNVINNVINTVVKIRLIKTFSVPPDKFPVYDAFCKVAKREAGARGFSETLLKAMEEYVKRHGVGNPQLLITHYVKPDEPTPLRVLCIYCDGALSNGEVYCQKAGGWVKSIKCYSCVNNRLRKKEEQIKKLKVAKLELENE